MPLPFMIEHMHHEMSPPISPFMTANSPKMTFSRTAGREYVNISPHVVLLMEFGGSCTPDWITKELYTRLDHKRTISAIPNS